MKKKYFAPALIDNLALEAEQILAGSPKGTISVSEDDMIKEPGGFGARSDQSIWDDDIE